MLVRNTAKVEVKLQRFPRAPRPDEMLTQDFIESSVLPAGAEKEVDDAFFETPGGRGFLDDGTLVDVAAERRAAVAAAEADLEAAKKAEAEAREKAEAEAKAKAEAEAAENARLEAEAKAEAEAQAKKGRGAK